MADSKWIVSIRARLTLYVVTCVRTSGLRQIYDSTREGSVPHPWPARAVLDAGVQFDALFESYDSLQMSENNAAVGGVDVATQ